MQEYLQVCEQAARTGGRVLMEWRDKVTVRTKGPKDLVTEADEAAQRVIRETLLGAYPDHRFVGEEDSPHDSTASRFPPDRPSVPGKAPYRWIVDPLDGTINYVHGLPSYAVSIGLERGGKLLVGVVYNPLWDECFSAVAGQGAYLNGSRIRTSGCAEASEALIAASLPTSMTRQSKALRRFIEVSQSCRSIRRLGSASLNLCYVACGRLDAYFASTVKPWDVAAGVLMVREAGGTVTALGGGPFDLERPAFTSAATVTLHAAVLEMLARAE